MGEGKKIAGPKNAIKSRTLALASITYLPFALLNACECLLAPINRIGFSGEFSICNCVCVCSRIPAATAAAAAGEKCAFHVPCTEHIFAIAFASNGNNLTNCNCKLVNKQASNQYTGIRRRGEM